MSQLAERMTRGVVAVTPRTSVAAARLLADQKCADHLLVLEGDELVGVVCPVCDLAHADPDRVVERYMHSPVLTIDVESTAEAAEALMCACHVGCLPVTVGSLVLGMVTLDDLGPGRPGADADAHVCAACGARNHLAPVGNDDGPLFCVHCRTNHGLRAIWEEEGDGD